MAIIGGQGTPKKKGKKLKVGHMISEALPKGKGRTVPASKPKGFVAKAVKAKAVKMPKSRTAKKSTY